MKPFSISCPTCQAKLKVRSASAIGQIHVCPKCDSMVQVTPPPGWRSPDELESMAAAGTDLDGTVADAGDSPEQPGSDQPDRKVAAAAAAALVDSPDPPVSAPAESPTSAGSNTAAATPAPPEAASAMSSTAAPPAPPHPVSANAAPLDPSWASPAEQLWQKWILYGTVGGLGLLVLGAATIYLFTRGGDPPPTPAIVAVDDAPNSASEKPEPAAKTDDTQPPAVPKVPAVEQPAEKKPPTELAKVEATGPPAKLPTDARLPAAPLPAAKPDPEAKPAPEDDPAGNAFPSLPAAPKAETPDPTKPKPQPKTTDEAIDEASALDSADASLAPVVRRTEADDAAEPVNVPARLADRFEQIDMRDVALADFAKFLSEMTTLPISLDTSALISAGISPQATVSVRASDTAIAEVLTNALSSRELTYLTEDDQLLITTRKASGQSLRSFNYPLDDLVAADQTEATEFADLLQRLIAPKSWKSAGRSGSVQLVDGKLAIEQTGSIHYQLVVFCDKLRVARGATPKSRYPADRFVLTPRQDQAADLLSRPVTCTFHNPTRLTDVVHYLEDTTGASILLDWQSLAAEDFRVTSEISCAIQQQSLGEALSSLLVPLGLAWRVIDARSIEIYSRQDEPDKSQVEFYSLRKAGDGAAALAEQIRRDTGANEWAENGGLGVLIYDRVSKYLVVRQRAAIHREISRLILEKFEPAKSNAG